MNEKLKKILPVLIVIIIAIVFSAIMIPMLSAKSNSAFQSKCVYNTINISTNTTSAGTNCNASMEILYMSNLIDGDFSIKAELVIETDSEEFTKTYLFKDFDRVDPFNDEINNLYVSKYTTSANIATNDTANSHFAIKKIKSVKYSTNYSTYKDAQQLDYDELESIQAEATKYNNFNHGTKIAYICITVFGYFIILFGLIASISKIWMDNKSNVIETNTISQKFTSTTGESNSTINTNATVTCAYCGAENNITDRKCSNCGASIKKNKNKAE